MRAAWMTLGLVVALAGCDGTQPLQFDGTGVPSAPTPPSTDPEDPTVPPTTLAVPANVAGNLRSASYTPPSASNPAGSLQVSIYALDGPTAATTYVRRPSLDLPGYTAYAYQDDPQDRMFIAEAARSPDGAVQGVLVASGEQFNYYFGGVDYERLGAYSNGQPGPNGLVSFAGDYAGMLNVGVVTPELLPYPGTADPENRPDQPVRVAGNVFLNVDWADMAVNGSITNRQIVDVGLPLQSLALVPTDIGSLGTFSGNVEILGETGNVVGRFSGLFGGAGATGVAGGIRMESDFDPELEEEEEYGVFVLVRCDLGGPAAACADTNPRP